LRSRGRRGSCAKVAAQVRARRRYSVMIGVRDPPPSTGSPRRRRCSSTRQGSAAGNFCAASAHWDSPTRPPRHSTTLRASRNRAFGKGSETARRLDAPSRATSGKRRAKLRRMRQRDRPLQDELKIEGQLEFADHDDRRVIAPQPNRSQPPISPLTTKPSPSRKVLDRPIEQCLQNRSSGSL
jgi:hypothetical protein